MEKEVLSDGAWVFFGQISSAAGTLVGVRLLTEVLEPSVYGSVALVMGVVALVLGVSSGGTLQAVLRLHPECAREGTLNLLYGAASRSLRKSTAWFAGVLALGCGLYSVSTQTSLWSIVFVPGLLILDTACTYQLVLLNAAQRQRLTAAFLGVGSWVRMLCALVGVKLLGASTESVMWGYLAGSGVLVAVFAGAARFPFTTRQPGVVSRAISPESHGDIRALEVEIYRYGRPLAFLGLVGWLSGQVDRYIIGGVLGLSSAGQYAAIHGLVSKPFLMAGGSMELALRQIFYESVSARDVRQARKVFWGWFAIAGAVGSLGVLVFSTLHAKIALVLLAESYRESAFIMPWIAIGYGLLLFAQVLERVCYAAKETGRVLLIQSAGAISSLPILLAGVLWSGMAGAAAAVPCYFGLQLVLALVYAHHAARTHIGQMRWRPARTGDQASGK